MAGASGGAGGMSNSSSAAAKSGDIRSSGDLSYGGINIGGKGFELNTQTMLVIGGVFVGVIVLKKLKVF
tara:strand:- start:3235 stop:3441 length:207 start_codon:yes stop_codon:yes gene_type:complete